MQVRFILLKSIGQKDKSSNYAYLHKQHQRKVKMMNFKFRCPDELNHIKTGIELVLNDIPIDINASIKASFHKDKRLIIDCKNSVANVHFSLPSELFRSIGIISSKINNNETTFHVEEKSPFRTMGIMYDCSRNSVPTVRTLQQLLTKAALMGYNAIMLYTEDTFEVPEYPQFGHYRGRYTRKEINAIDDIAYSLGIELIPCIQTLAHLERFFVWPCTEELKDSDNVLLVNDEKVTKFITTIIDTISSCVRSNRIHLGLDEADGLGLGRKLERDGYVHKIDIMKHHTEVVIKICDERNLRPMMWGDMLFRLYNTGGGYYSENFRFPESAKEKVVHGIDFIYWDYYHTDKEFYDNYIKEHKKLGINPVFAGGVCSWIGMVPNLVRTAQTTKCSTQSCKQEGVEEMFLCVWKDNGGEAPVGADLLGMLMYAEHCINDEATALKNIVDNARIMTGADYECFMEIGRIDEIQQGLSMIGLEAPNPHKYFLWQDLMLGIYDVEASVDDFATIYSEKAKKLGELIDTGNYCENSRYDLDLAWNLCRALEIKVDLGIKLKKAYDAKDKSELNRLADFIEGEYTERIEALYNSHRKAWMYFYKPFGFEIADVKYGGLLARAKTSVLRIKEYVNGNIDFLDELEQQRLTSSGAHPNGKTLLPHSNLFDKISSPSCL